MTTPRIEEMVKEFKEYSKLDGIGLHCDDCDCKYLGKPQINQLCPMCRARVALTQAHQAGRDEAVEVMESKRGHKLFGFPVIISEKPEVTKSEAQFFINGYNQALDDTIKALQDNK